MIAHPPCTYLSLSGVRWLHRRESFELDQFGNETEDSRVEEKRVRVRWKKMEEAAVFFKELLSAPIEKICVENPLPHRHGLLPKFTQSVQPYEFGEDASKRTCLWLKNLPPLVPTQYIEPRIVDGKKRWGNQTDSGQNKLAPSEDRGMLRSITYQGIADAMAEQWG